ncbi:MAG: DUF2793 domain-containing protein [Phreatobacter sp.]|uniref:DUF2793 domain-containing protein n=1 Tax=Phreatobacter sp. TaxID=1966341 RepID=UPI004035379B
MSDTARLSLPVLAAAQAQKHVTHNEALVVLDRLVLLAVDSRSLSAPPAGPGEGGRWLVAAGAAGDWAGHAGDIAIREGGAWHFHAPRPGWLAYVVEEDLFVVRTAAGWRAFAVGDTLPQLGINATADATNRLAVAAAATLFSHAGAGHQVKIDKSAPEETASLVFQTGFSGRAEIGTAGSDRLQVKVSADGASWIEALTVDPATGFLGIGTAAPAVSVEVTGHVGRISSHNFASWAVRATGAGGREYRFAATDDSNGLGGGRFVLFDQTLSAIRFMVDDHAMQLMVPPRVPAHAVAALPSAAASGAGALVFIGDESGGPVLAFSDGAAWRRVTDRAVAA